MGLAISSFSFLTILIKSDTRKSKLLWTAVVVLAIGLQWLTEPLLIKTSYRLFINKNERELESVTKLISSKERQLFISPASDLWTRNGYSQDEANLIRENLKNTGIHFITKDSIKIYYQTWGMLDVSHGIYYFYADTEPDKHYQKIKGNWYY